MRSMFICAAAFAVASSAASAQPEGPPPVLDILRESVKEGKSAAHEKAETAYVRAFRKAKFNGHYLAMASMSGPSEVWFLGGQSSFADAEKFRTATNAEPLKSEIEAAENADGALRESSRRLWAVFRKDLSYRPDLLNVAKSRFVSVGVYRVRLGHDEDFMAGSKAIFGAYEKANLQTPLLCYQVVAGAPTGTYLFFFPMESLKTMDEAPARGAAIRQAMGAESFQKLMRGTGDTFVTIESHLFAFSPSMSYAPPDIEDGDPAFWKPKPAAAAKPKPAQ